MERVELRAFQREVLELAREKNVVMVGETGIGKTFLAIALLSEQDYSGDRRAFFMAPTRQLVVQITAKIRQTSTLRVNSYCGRTADLWDATQWERELQLTRVFVCTPEIVRNVLLKGYVSLSRMNLLVFDECHHVTKRHPYAQVIKMFNQETLSSMPRIFGTTACPTRHCAEKLHAEMKKVELDKSQIAEFAAAAPMIYETFPVQQSWVEGEKTDGSNTAWIYESIEKELAEVKAVAVLKKLIRKGKSDAAADPKKLEKATKKFTQNCITIYKNLGPWCYYRFVEIEIHRLAIAASLLITIPGSMFGLDRDAVKTMLLLAGKRSTCDFACSAKVQKVEEILRTQLFGEEDGVDEVAGAELDDSDGLDSDDEPNNLLVSGEKNSTSIEENETQVPRTKRSCLNLQGVVFVDTRTECRVLSDFFNDKFSTEKETEECEVEPSAELNGANSEEMKDELFASILGRASRNDTASFQMPKMETILKKFESGSIRVLISTAVSAEGIDFPQCGLIVVMDRVETARKLMQLKGRARHEDGVVYYLAEEGDLAHEVYFKQLLREVEVINQLEFSKEKVETLYQQPRSIAAEMMGAGVHRIEIESTGAVLDLDSSIACINQFCQSLPTRLFTVNVKQLYSVTEARNPMPSKASARASAAFSACQKLLEQHLIDDSLNSIYRTSKVKSSSNDQDGLLTRETASNSALIPVHELSMHLKKHQDL
ncbi:endoribonuclease dicer homolog 1-like [Plasmopara halstedii]|uniref:Endoribonuclease dicer homolog 1-like n=1 Tax=Plasmopara halstedii TaxID=4781 RepID=A0A0P1ASC7_PLAHL|nr:endoribonuclease dicer homolog 1-like [Plasmopara halstedii]CEG44838.1 endoribonuclease dicer homolog 1-like [Plasmopara halstedii]|eukprot:XP_024581207.1 endoribonuclease dicer homolog 1-like [Plasmopara halstedii]